VKFTYLGTSSAEGFPGLFCNCKNCAEVRRLGSSNFRTRTQALINDDLLLDFPADTYHHFLQCNVEAHKIKYLFITHSHPDHYYTADLGYHYKYWAMEMESPVLKVFCGKGAYAKLGNGNPPRNIETVLLSPFDVVELDGYRVTALPARHAGGDGALIYLIEGDKTVLYAHDTGFFYDEVFDYLKEKGVHLDMVSYDCAAAASHVDDTGNHMGFDNVVRVRERLVEIGAVDGTTIHVINHFSHHANPLQGRMEKLVRDKDLLVSFDGRVLEI